MTLLSYDVNTNIEKCLDDDIAVVIRTKEKEIINYTGQEKTISDDAYYILPCLYNLRSDYNAIG